MEKCSQDLPGQSAGRFELVMEISQNGDVSRVLVRPENPVTRCLRSGLSSGTYSPPPFSSFYVGTTIEPLMAEVPD